jgi:NAD(P)H-hydrate epimerase
VEAHKGTFGTVIVVGGSQTMIGAPALAAAAALRGGAGLVKVATKASILSAVLTIEPGATGIILGDDEATTLHLLDKIDPENKAVLAIGPGLGQEPNTKNLVLALLGGSRAIVLDADGLNLLAASLTPLQPREGPGEVRTADQQTDRAAQSDPPATSHAQSFPAPSLRRAGTGPLILTPHPGEFLRLAAPLKILHSATDPATRPAAAAALARALGAVVVLKGPATIVTDGSRRYTNTTGNPALATAGSGDILTGLTAALLAQRVDPFDAAVLAVYLHGLAADLWANVHGTSGLTARDLATLLPDAFNLHRPGP